MQKLFRSLIAVGGLAGLVACGDDVSITPPPAPPLTISGAPVTAVLVGARVQLSASEAVTWSSSAANVASVDGTGLVSAAAAGTASIIATSTADVSKKASVTITVAAVPTPPNAVRSVAVSPPNATVQVGATLQVVANVDADPGVARTVTWTSSNTTVASVSTGGVVTANAAGTAAIVATSTANTTIFGAMALTVNAPAPATVSIKELRQGGPGVVGQINLDNIAGQVEVHLNVDPGDQQVDKVQVLINGVVVAEEAAARVMSADGEAAPVLREQVLNINTATYDRTTGVARFSNGLKSLTARLLLVGGGTVNASRTEQLTFRNTSGSFTKVTTAGGKKAVSPVNNLEYVSGSYTVSVLPVLYGDITEPFAAQVLTSVTIAFNGAGCDINGVLGNRTQTITTPTGSLYTATFANGGPGDAAVDNVAEIEFSPATLCGFFLGEPPFILFNNANGVITTGLPNNAFGSLNSPYLGASSRFEPDPSVAIRLDVVAPNHAALLNAPVVLPPNTVLPYYNWALGGRLNFWINEDFNMTAVATAANPNGPMPAAIDLGSGGVTYTAHVGACADADADIDGLAATNSGATADSPNNAQYRLRIKATDVVGNTVSNDVGPAVGGDCFGVSKPDPVMTFITGASTAVGVNNNLTGLRDNATLGLGAWNFATTAIYSVSTSTTGAASFSGALANIRTNRLGAPNGGCIINFVAPNCLFSASNVTTLFADAANAPGFPNSMIDGYYTGEFFAQDDAGNKSPTITRKAAVDRVPPSLDGVSVFGLGSLPFGAAASFTSGVIDNVDVSIGGITTIYGAAFPAYRYPHKVLNTLFGTPKTIAPIVDGPAVLARTISPVPFAHVPLTHAMAWAVDAGENLNVNPAPTAISGALVPVGNGAAAFANVAAWATTGAAGNLSRDGLSGGGTPTTRTFTATLTLAAGNLNPFSVVQLFWQDPNGMRRFIGNATTVTNPALGTWTFAFTWNPSTTDVTEDIAQITFAPLVGGGVIAVGIDNLSIPANLRGDGLLSTASAAFNIVR